MARLIPFDFLPGKSPIHRAPALLKLASFLSLSILSLLVPPLILALFISFFILITLLARRSPLILLAGFLPLLFLLSSVTLLGILSFTPLSIDTGALPGRLIYSLRIVCALMAANLYFSTSGGLETHRALAAAQDILKIPLLALFRLFGLKRAYAHIQKSDPALLIGLCLSFLPQVFSSWETLKTARMARAGRLGLRANLALIPVLLERLILQAKERERAMLIRGRIVELEGHSRKRGTDT